VDVFLKERLDLLVVPRQQVRTDRNDICIRITAW
jgi:hypothetical protein